MGASDFSDVPVESVGLRDFVFTTVAQVIAFPLTRQNVPGSIPEKRLVVKGTSISTAERLARGYVMVACVPCIRLKNGRKLHAAKYGKRCFPIWVKSAKATP